MRLVQSPPALKKSISEKPIPSQAPQPQPNVKQPSVSPRIWWFFIGSVVFCLGVIFVGSWTSSGPTLFPSGMVNPLQRDLPLSLQAPTVIWDLLLPVVVTTLVCAGLRFVRPTNFSRTVIKLLLLALGVRYFYWRTFVTLNFSHWASGLFSIILYGMEAIAFFSFCLHIVQTIRSTEDKRRAQADRYEIDVREGRYQPTVDVFVPTYNEPDYIVRRTVIGAQAMEYPNRTIYILDDTRRSHIKALAEELGCEYITRPDNAHAKAGNLNNALNYTNGELITILDADFVPFKNFLTRTVGFFQNPKLSLLQTPQNFYNPDYHSRNLGVDHFLPNDLEHFYGYLQSNRDAGNSVICCGSSYVVRRSSLEAVGGYYTRCCVEDYQTSLRMLCQKMRLGYLNETLSMGESTRTYSDFIDQRLRWLQGNFQVYFCGDELPIWKKLTWTQKGFIFSQLIYCIQSFIRFVFLISPLVTVYTGISPLIATPPEIVHYFFPFWVLNVASYGWAADYRGSFFWYEVYETIFCFPFMGRMLRLFRNPFAKTSKVTRKGVKADTKNYNLALNWPLFVLIGLSVIAIVINLVGSNNGLWPSQDVNSSVLFFWLCYNTFLMIVAVMSAIDQPVRRLMDRFPLKALCKVYVGDREHWGHTINLSESGALVKLNDPMLQLDDLRVEVEFVEYGFKVKADILRVEEIHSDRLIAVQFVNVTTAQYRPMIEVLYTQMHSWKTRKQPGGIDALLAMFAAVLQARPILARYNK